MKAPMKCLRVLNKWMGICKAFDYALKNSSFQCVLPDRDPRRYPRSKKLKKITDFKKYGLNESFSLYTIFMKQKIKKSNFFLIFRTKMILRRHIFEKIHYLPTNTFGFNKRCTFYLFQPKKVSGGGNLYSTFATQYFSIKTKRKSDFF